MLNNNEYELLQSVTKEVDLIEETKKKERRGTALGGPPRKGSRVGSPSIKTPELKKQTSVSLLSYLTCLFIPNNFFIDY